MAKKSIGTYQVRYRLPAAYSTEIGRIMTRWAYLEWRMRETAYALLSVGPKLGRVAVREPRAREYLTMVRDLLAIKKIGTSVDLKQLDKTLERLKFYRDALAHGIWLYHDKTKNPVLQVIAGSYQPGPQQQKVRARIDPQAVEISLKNLQDVVVGIESVTGAINVLKREIEARLAP